MQISLVIATYNRGPAIAPTLESVLSQVPTVSELIVVDDGSPDKTGEWVQQYYPSVRVLFKENGGTSSARNYGAAHARHDWLMFLDHDDLLLPGAVKTFGELQSAFPQAVSLHCDHVYENEVTQQRFENHHDCIAAFHRLKSVATVQRNSTGRLFGVPLYESLLKGNLLQQPYVVKKEAFHAVNGYDNAIRYCEDWDLYLRLAKNFYVALSDAVVSVHCVGSECLHLTGLKSKMSCTRPY